MSKLKALTWKELADLYNKSNNGRRAQTLPMDNIFSWAEKQTDKFILDKYGYLYLK